MSETDCKKIIDGKLETDRGTRRRKRDIHHKRKTAKDRQRATEREGSGGSVVGAFGAEGSRFESQFSRHAETLAKYFTRSCL